MKLDVKAEDFPKRKYVLKSKWDDESEKDDFQLPTIDLTENSPFDLTDEEHQQALESIKAKEGNHLKKDGETDKDEMPGLKPRKLPVVVETVDEDKEHEEECRSPMEDAPLGEQAEVREHDDDDVPHKENVSDKPCPNRKEGDKLDFSQDLLPQNGE